VLRQKYCPEEEGIVMIGEETVWELDWTWWQGEESVSFSCQQWK
jgi:hypothetical protein